MTAPATAKQVCPAPAGMIRSREYQRSVLLRLPRASGDDPLLGHSSVETTTQLYVAMPDSRLRVGLGAVSVIG